MQPWSEKIEPLLKLYGKRKHPLDYQNRYQLLVMVILSARDSDKHINELSKSFFEQYPTMSHLAKASIVELHQCLGTITNFANKAEWLLKIAQTIGEDNKIPATMAELTKLPGIGRKSANVIIRESGFEAEGVIVDLHVVRVAPRLGIATGSNPEKIEKQIMSAIPQARWNETGMAISFLGREICRPSNPKCEQCVMNSCCEHNGV
ncbi:MAG TPA: endonuclease III [Bacteroidales bacterium]|nr:endonuclease III [Bacteroidales bacterium]